LVIVTDPTDTFLLKNPVSQIVITSVSAMHFTHLGMAAFHTVAELGAGSKSQQSEVG
jgi:NO-binding membrane sensor protein with MHYT domain